MSIVGRVVEYIRDDRKADMIATALDLVIGGKRGRR